MAHVNEFTENRCLPPFDSEILSQFNLGSLKPFKTTDSSPLCVLRCADENVIFLPNSKFSWIQESKGRWFRDAYWEGPGAGVASLLPSLPTKWAPVAVFWCLLLILVVSLISLKFNFQFLLLTGLTFISCLNCCSELETWQPSVSGMCHYTTN